MSTAQKTRRPGGKTVSAALEEIIRKEIASGIKDVFGNRSSNKGAGGASAGTFGGGPFGDGGGPRQQGSFDRKQMENMIDELVASSLTNGRQTSRILRALFGLVPSLIGR